jgi:hypothetical protein
MTGRSAAFPLVRSRRAGRDETKLGRERLTRRRGKRSRRMMLAIEDAMRMVLSI